MKKLLYLVLSAFMLSGFFMVGNASAFTPSHIDQFDTTSTVNGNYPAYHMPIGQSFKPTKNQLESISLYMLGKNGQDLSIKVTAGHNPASANILGSTPTIHGAGNINWYVWDFAPVTVTTNSEYTVWLTTAVGDTTSLWYQNITNPYANGMAYTDGGAQPNYDYGFATYGYNILLFIPNFDFPGSGTTPAADSPSGGNEAAATTAAPAVTDQSIQVPVMTKLLINDKETEFKDKAIVTVTTDKLILSGTSFAGASVNVYFGETGYKATADATGNWTVTVKAAGLKVGEDITVQGQSQKDDKGSDKVTFFKLKVNTPVTAKEGMVAGWFSWVTLPIVLIIVGALMLVLLALTVLIIRQSRKHAAAAKKAGVDVSEKPEKEKK